MRNRHRSVVRALADFDAIAERLLFAMQHQRNIEKEIRFSNASLKVSSLQVTVLCVAFPSCLVGIATILIHTIRARATAH